MLIDSKKPVSVTSNQLKLKSVGADDHFPWGLRIGIAVFVLSFWQWRLWPAIFITILYFVLLLWMSARSSRRHTPGGSAYGTARFANNADLSESGNLVMNLGLDRYVLGVSRERVRLRNNQTATLSSSAGPWQGSSGNPVIVTGNKDASRGKVDDTHCLTVAGAGSGKGVSVVNTNLHTYSGPVVNYDPKGENFKNALDARLRLGHRVYLIDPFEAVEPALRDRYLARMNPLQPLEEYYLAGKHNKVDLEATALADAMVLTTGSEKDPHWNDKAKEFIKAAILGVTYLAPYQDRVKYPLNLVTVKTFIFRWFESAEKMSVFVSECKKIRQLQAAGGTIAMIAGEERSSVLANVLKHTAFLDSPDVQESLSGSDFPLGDLKRAKISLFLVIPANYISAYSRLGRIWVATLLRAMMADTTVPPLRVLFLLDEVGQLGKLDPLIQALTLGRGYGLDVWMLWQDIGQMKAAYGESWQTFFANTAYQQFFGVRDNETAKYLVERIGKQTITIIQRNRSKSKTRGTTTGNSYGESYSSSGGTNDGVTDQEGEQETILGRELLTLDEIMRLSDKEQILLIGSQFPVLAQKFDTRENIFREALENVTSHEVDRDKYV